MATSVICPECGNDLGKDTENFKLAYCDRCGEDNIPNPYGQDFDEDE